ncbi:hypothetical protein [Halalkaliarchaeum desulfuricum]|uniref:hypothetical protein n=1 Tax=Halalkaliarchaeum desulfuricum TaxID=2055893 RepID=UPI000E6C47B4|nr:hypothetical protein [Halalkaliarchaeum desulfuricum]
MRKDILLLDFTRQPDEELEVEAQTTVGYLKEIKKQLERTVEWGQPCVSLEIARNPKMVGRIGAHVAGDDYEKISGGKLGPSHTSFTKVEAERIKVQLQLDRKQLIELATINNFDTGKDPHRWTTTIPHEAADRIIEQIEQL